MKKKIAFLFPGRDTSPCGGYKIAYEYANRFSQIGYDVALVYPHIETFFSKENKNIFIQIKKYFGMLINWKLKKRLKAGEWFSISSQIQKIHIFKISNFYLRKKLKGYKIIATAVETAYALNKISFIPDADKFYFIQGFEQWNGKTAEEIYESYRFPLKKIVIAPWLQKEVEKTGNTAFLIPNGFDFNYFKLTQSIEKRSPFEIAMLYHKDDVKRCCDSIDALKIVKTYIPQLHVTMFGTPEKPDLPEWFSYYQCPDKETHNSIYNNASIFVAASKTEGMALPPAEAMICGAALCCTDIGGFSLYAKNNTTALLSPVYDVKKLADNILLLINNQKLRIELAENGHNYIQQFTWENAFSLFKNFIEGNTFNDQR